ncbi:MAG: hypothetical protein M1818_007647 [Claussenomyces sp. TS43310]|nr:MAG: hypothetical protein M1818_007647 [Claussenomyces sp. TS43310]
MATMITSGRHGMQENVSFNQGHALETTTQAHDTASNASAASFSTLPISAMPNSAGPLPNPPFVFPARQMSSSAPSSFSKPTGSRRTMSAFDLEDQREGSTSEVLRSTRRPGPPPLPNFSFNPSGTSGVEVGMNSPPVSPSTNPSSIPIASRSGGHRRGGSEFIGGDGKSGAGAGPMSTSPTKGDGILPPPSAAASFGSSAGRRGHAHRRSAAISCHDLSMVLQPASANGTQCGGSAPTSPSQNENKHFVFPKLGSLPMSTSDPNIVSNSGPRSNPPESPKVNSAVRTRVGFSDTIEFIPRPLSLVSSDTSSTATMRPGHSVSGSLSSIVSVNAAVSGNATASPAKECSLPSPAPSIKSNDSRPSTAGAVLGHTADAMSFAEDTDSPRRRNSTPLIFGDPGDPSNAVTGPLTPKGSKKYMFFGAESSGEVSPTKFRPVSSGSSDKARSSSSAPSSPSISVSEEPVTTVEEPIPIQRKTSHVKKHGKKQKRVKSWAGSILSRKPRPRSQKTKALNRRSPTPPLRAYEPTIEDPAQFEEDCLATEDGAIAALPSLDTNISSWRPRQVSPCEEESMSPMIDLDAALGPFNTPTAYDQEWEASQRGGTTMKKRMHSGAPSRGFLRMDIPYHRRSESAPEMENPRLFLHRLGSSSTMADVFEEDEEEDWSATKPISDTAGPRPEDEGTSGLGIGVNVVDAEEMHADKTMDWTTEENIAMRRGLKRKGSGLSEGDRRQATSSVKSVNSERSSQGGSVIEEQSAPSKIASKPVNPRQDSGTQSSASTATPPLGPTRAKDLAPVDIQKVALQPPFLTPTSQQSSLHSPFPSPRTPISYDTQRILTASSSFTDEQNYQSLLLGEPGPEIRMSVDEVPSIASSRSTATKEDNINPIYRHPQLRGSQRSVSMSGPALSRKRSSMASLTRLLHSSHGEKSKLSIEERAPESPDTDRKDKSSKGKRFSRMMQFWKPKNSSEI